LARPSDAKFAVEANEACPEQRALPAASGAFRAAHHDTKILEGAAFTFALLPDQRPAAAAQAHVAKNLDRRLTHARSVRIDAVDAVYAVGCVLLDGFAASVRSLRAVLTGEAGGAGAAMVIDPVGAEAAVGARVGAAFVDVVLAGRTVPTGEAFAK
jgi:hypothetical protein